MRFWAGMTGLLIAAGGFEPAGAEQPATVEAVRPGGPGVLTKCRNWVVARSCHHYHHIDLPARIAVGDMISLSYGSSTKEYDFPVVRIALEGDHCTIFAEKSGDGQREDKIDVAPCYPTEPGR
jgi:hypothetical protein